MKKNLKSIIIVTVLWASIPQNAYAYIDPSTGSYILQTLLATVLGLSFLIKTYWNKIKHYFKKSSH